MSKPIRIQRKRTNGWKMPPNTVYVGRPSRWGNPFSTHEPERNAHGDLTGRMIEIRSAQEAVRLFSKEVVPYRHEEPYNGLDTLYKSIATMEAIQLELRGKNLACFCPLDHPCHADILLEIANGELIK